MVRSAWVLVLGLACDCGKEVEGYSVLEGLAAQNPTGSCVQPEPLGTVPEVLYRNSGVYSVSDYPPFSKAVMVNGILLLGQAENSDAFMEDVAAAVEALFSPAGEAVDAELQALVITSMYQRKTAIPLFVGDSMPDWSNQEWRQFDTVAEQHSICDAIYEYGGPGQTMEVMEHILHHVNMTGLHYALIDDWGMLEGSTVHAEMNAAIDSGYFNVGDYAALDGDPERERILLQEYAYWVITTGWDLQTRYGGDGGGGEWTLQDPADFQAAQPIMSQVFADTIPRVMVPLSDEMLAGFGG